jgi:hypothetical protein
MRKRVNIFIKCHIHQKKYNEKQFCYKKVSLSSCFSRIAVMIIFFGCLVASPNENSKDDGKFIVKTLDEMTKDQSAAARPADVAQQALVEQVFKEIERDMKNEKVNLLKSKKIKSINYLNA